MTLEERIVAAWASLVVEWCTGIAVDPYAVLAIICHESQGNPTAQNISGPDGVRGGSYGLMQMSLLTAQGMKIGAVTPAGLLDPETNIRLGARFLAGLLVQEGGNYLRAIQAYNGSGPAAQAYAQAVWAIYTRIRPGAPTATA